MEANWILKEMLDKQEKSPSIGDMNLTGRKKKSLSSNLAPRKVCKEEVIHQKVRS